MSAADNTSGGESLLSEEELIRQLGLQNPQLLAVINAAQTNLTNNNTTSAAATLDDESRTPAAAAADDDAIHVPSRTTDTHTDNNNSRVDDAVAGLMSIKRSSKPTLPTPGATPANRLRNMPSRGTPSTAARRSSRTLNDGTLNEPTPAHGRRRGRAKPAASDNDDSDMSEEEEPQSMKTRTSGGNDGDKKMPAKSDRALRLEKWEKQKSIQHDNDDDDSSEVSDEEPPSKKRCGGKQSIKVTAHGKHSNENEYPRTGLYFIRFLGVLCLGKSVPSNKRFGGLGERIKKSHGKVVQRRLEK